MTTYLAAYDVENAERCPGALPAIVEQHERHAMPATFFIATHLLAGRERELRRLLERPLFEIASHSHSHSLLAAHRRSDAPPVPESQLPDEIQGSRKRLEDLFGRAVIGFRPPWGYADGFRHCLRHLALLSEGGYRYVSSVLWGPGDTMPAAIVPPFTYAEQGFPGLWEVPGCGWHENVAKQGFASLGHLVLSPPLIPEAALTQALQTPEEEFALNRVFLDRSVAQGMPHVTLIWHPWSLGRFDPPMRMLDLTFRYVRECGLTAATFAAFVESL